MAFVFQPDPALAGFNSFCDLTTADDYQSIKLNTTWAGLSNANKEKLLAWATLNINSLSFIGIRTNPVQLLEWPRSWVPVTGTQASATDDPYSVYYLDPDTVPIEIKQATAEMAGILMAGDVTADSGLGEFSEIKVSEIMLKMKDMPRTGWLKSSVKNLMYRFLTNASPYNYPTRRVG